MLSGWFMFAGNGANSNLHQVFTQLRIDIEALKWGISKHGELYETLEPCQEV